MKPTDRKDTSERLVLVHPSTAARPVARKSTRHMSGQVVVGDVEPRIVVTESHLETLVLYCLMARPETQTVHEQVEFAWTCDDVQRKHFFDFVVTETDGRRIAYSVRPADRYTSALAQNLPLIAEQALASRQYADVRLFTDRHLDRASIANATLMHACRISQPVFDKMACDALRRVKFPISIGALVGEIGAEGQGFRAVVRLLKERRLILQKSEKISYSSVVYMREAA